MQIEKHDGVVKEPQGTRRSAVMPDLVPIPTGAKAQVKRRINAYNRLSWQLHRGQKPEFVERNGKKVQSKNTVDLSVEDRFRIVTEMQTLKTRI